MITGHLTEEQLTAYQEYFRSEEITHLLNIARQQHRPVPEILPSAKFESSDPQLKYKRDPSPPPKYDRDGMKINTRDRVVREALEKERHEMVELAAGSIKGTCLLQTILDQERQWRDCTSQLKIILKSTLSDF